jgi:hypothetical protein
MALRKQKCKSTDIDKLPRWFLNFALDILKIVLLSIE